MKILRVAASIAVCALLAFASAPAGSHGFTGGTHMRGGHSGGAHGGRAHVDGAPFVSQPGIGHFHGAHGQFAHRGAFRHDGRFVHGFRGGNLGWFFVVGGFWYPWSAYPSPVYTNAWYYCPSAAVYYPAVTYCPEGWVLVEPSAPAL